MSLMLKIHPPALAVELSPNTWQTQRQIVVVWIFPLKSAFDFAAHEEEFCAKLRHFHVVLHAFLDASRSSSALLYSAFTLADILARLLQSHSLQLLSSFVPL
jgi:hypothetical protein